MADLGGVCTVIRLGCPFCGRNPERYKKCRSCNGAGFTELSQVKDHLKRVHPARCPNCSFVFAGSPIEEHARQHPACKYRPRDDVEYMTEQQWHEVRRVPRRCRRTSPGEQWKVIFKKLFANGVPVPQPYLPSLDQYRQIAGNPPPAFLSALQARILTSARLIPFVLDENMLRSCLELVVPALFDLVGEDGLFPGNPPPPMPAPQLLCQTVAATRPEMEMDKLVADDHHDGIYDDAEGMFCLEDVWYDDGRIT